MSDCDYQGENCDGVAVHFFEDRETGSRDQCCDPCLREIRSAEAEGFANANAAWAERMAVLLGEP